MFTETDELDNLDTKMKYGAIYQNLKTYSASAMYVPAIFLIRRACYVIALNADIFALKFGGMIFCVLC